MIGAFSVLAPAALAIFVARTINARAAIYAVLILLTTPEGFLSAPTDASRVNASIVGVSLLGIAGFDRTSPRPLRVALIAALIVIGVFRLLGLSATPVAAMAIAVTILVHRHDRLIAFLSGLLGVFLLVSLIRAASIERAPITVTSTVARLAYGAPWSALLPFALLSRSREPARHAVLLTLVLTLAASTIFQSPAHVAGLIATSIALWLADLDSGYRALPVAAGVGALCTGLILARDLDLSPERVVGVLLESGHPLTTARTLRVGILALTGATFAVAITPARFARRGMILIAVGFIAGAVLQRRLLVR